jgi:hypothetical protein
VIMNAIADGSVLALLTAFAIMVFIDLFSINQHLSRKPCTRVKPPPEVKTAENQGNDEACNTK